MRSRSPYVVPRGEWLVLWLPIETQSESNSREHWRHKHARAKAQKLAVGYALTLVSSLSFAPILPTDVVRLVRVSPRKLDGDNLQGALKAVRDEVAMWLFGGRPGQRDDWCRWEYDQRRGATHERAVEIWLRKAAP